MKTNSSLPPPPTEPVPAVLLNTPTGHDLWGRNTHSFRLDAPESATHGCRADAKMHTQTAPDAKEVFEELRQTLLWEIDHPKEGMASKIAQLAEAMERLIPAIPVKRSPWADVLAAMQGELQTIIDKVRAINPNARGHVNAARSTDVLLLMRCALQIEERSFVLLISYKPTKDITAIDVRAELRNESTGETLMRRRSTVCEITSEELIDASREILPTLEILQEMAA